MSNYNQPDIKMYYNNIASARLHWKIRNSYYNNYLKDYFSFLIPPHSKVIELGCGTGDLLNAVKPAYGLGIDFSDAMLGIASQRFPHLHFFNGDVENLELNETFDYVIISDLFHISHDVQKVLDCVKRYTTVKSRIIISSYSYLWELPLRLAELVGLKQKSPVGNWLSANDIFNLLKISDFELIKHDRKILLPLFIPLFSFLCNKFLVNFAIINHLGLINFIVARPNKYFMTEYSVSIIIPAKNESGNIENAITRTPIFGRSQQFIFIEGNSADGTFEEMVTIQKKYPEKNILIAKQSGKGKGNAVREGFEMATGEMLMILDADLTTPPESLPKFYDVIRSNKGEFINGCRLVYPMEKGAMRFLNLLSNKLFSWFFSYLLGQHIKDTLCGTKVLMKADYWKIKENRSYFGDFDPFGDFDLLLGAAKLNLKILEVYIKYKDREYGATQISRFKHGWLLLKMCWFAAGKIKFI
jgi:SAM-dependent methyltransferase